MTTKETHQIGDTFLIQFVWTLPDGDFIRALFKAEVLDIIEAAEKYMVCLTELAVGSQETSEGHGRDKEEFNKPYWKLVVNCIGQRVTVAWEAADGRPLHMRLATLTGEHDFFSRYQHNQDQQQDQQKEETSVSSALPTSELLQQQAHWLAPARARLLRQASIAQRQRILDLGAGYGSVTSELTRRAGGTAVAFDREWAALRQIDTAVTVAGDAHRLPFAADSFDLVFCQCVLLWLSDVVTAVAEIQRVLQPGGVLIALEPDYGGLIEHPPEIVSRDLWLSVLARLGADPFVGRKLPGLLHEAGFQVRVSLLDELMGAEDGRFAFLRTLPLTEVETVQLVKIENANAQLDQEWQQIVHLPFFLMTAVKRGQS